MKKLLKKDKYSFKAITIALICLLSISLQAQVERNKQVNKAFSAKEIVKLEHRNGPLTVKASEDGRVRFEASISVKAQNDEDAQTVLDHFDVAISENGNSLDLITKFEVENWNTVNNKTKLKFKGGGKVSNLRDLKIDFVLYVPSLKALTLKNKYDNIIINDNLAGDLNIELYSGRIEAGNISGKLNVTMKYSKGHFGNFVDAQLTVYDCDLDFGNGRSVSLTSKYSKLKLGNLEAIDMEIYDDKIQIGDITANVTLIDKYSDIKLGRFENARMDLYDSDIVMTEGNDIQLKSKYTSFKATSLNNLHFELSYDDEVDVEHVGFLSAESKYTDFTIGTLGSGLQLNSFDDDLNIGKMIGPLENITFTGKYTDLSIKLEAPIKYQLEANLTYGKMVFTESDYDYDVYKEANDRFEFKGRIKGATNESPIIQITSYDGKIVLQ